MLLFSSLFSMAQEQHAYIKNFEAQAFGDRLLVSWTTKSGFSCQDIVIQLSTDSVVFANKATYFGICGDTTERNYSITVDNPYLNAVNYVRLDLGKFGYSYVVSEEVIYITAAEIVPMPVQESSILYFENTLREELTINFYSFQGEKVYSYITTGNSHRLSEFKGSKGVYIYTITKSNRVIYRSKFVL
jgi:hypothetical protein